MATCLKEEKNYRKFPRKWEKIIDQPNTYIREMFVSYVLFLANLPKTFTMSDFNKEINILILGETGVGKSTWINGFANYLTFKTLKEAKKGKQIYLVPSRFAITDSNYEARTIEVGEAENESFQVNYF